MSDGGLAPSRLWLLFTGATSATTAAEVAEFAGGDDSPWHGPGAKTDSAFAAAGKPLGGAATVESTL
eukprot:CAMPEP_0178414888 /NCGR_PEP_ID=MMETSP0689_2-20121128/23268_1 /TAXON_ID=160604 /ORGANISM="Amphidinium massartii, Strain CS-259" /LENGTH=66 /DNA_ID=CAMNT_0020036191 /DNA_START=409 /DNA_END=609 /DNA_ORIENTATION=-